MKLLNFTGWKENLRKHWIEEENLPSSAIPQLDSYISDLETAVDNYSKDTELLNTFKDLIVTIVAYVKLKFDVTFDGDPGVPDSIENNDLRNWFSFYDLEISEDYGSYFSYDAVSYSLLTTSEYDNLLTTLNNASGTDINTIKSFRETFGQKVKKKIIYQSLNPELENVQVENIDVKSFILNDMYGKDVLDLFGWKIYGLNTNDMNELY